eukprot:c24915_g1_i1 orf=495-2534(-)
MASLSSLRTGRLAGLVAAVLLLILWCCLVGEAQADGFYGLEFALSQAHLDPSAQNDSFLSLPASLKRSLAQEGNFDIQAKIRSLLSLQITVPVTVKLVGFFNDGAIASLLSDYINALTGDDDRIKVIGGEAHNLAIKAKTSVEVTMASKQLADRIHRAIELELRKSSSQDGFSNLQPVSYTLIDEIIQEDLQKPLSSYAIYLLNVKSQARPYAYNYSRTEASFGASTCLGSIWTSTDRYLWIDLTAGPISYGPYVSGEGFMPRSELHPLAIGHSVKQDQLAAELASLIWSASRMLLVPALRIPRYFQSKLQVNFVHIQASDDEPSMKRLDFDAIEKAFLVESNNGFLLKRQQLIFKWHSLNFSTCDVCVAAVSHSLRSFTARFFYENYTLFINQYLDSQQLHFALQNAKRDLEIKAGVDYSVKSRTVYVYILDLDNMRPILLDRYHQAMAFKDMVIAVRSGPAQYALEYNCNGRRLFLQVQELERPIVAALLHTLWGVTSTHLTWSREHNSTIVDYTWAAGQTPFGPFADMMSLSFVQRDAVSRNTILTTLNSSITTATEILRSVKTHGGGKKVMGQKRHAEFIQRCNVFIFKLEKVVSGLSHFDFNMALYFLESSKHDLYALHKIAYDSITGLQANLVCFSDPPFPWGSVLLFPCLLSVFLYLIIRRDNLFFTKKKLF